MKISRKNLLTLCGAIILAGAIIVGGIYGPTAWKVIRGPDQASADQVVIQTPTVNFEDLTPQEEGNDPSSGSADPTASSTGNEILPAAGTEQSPVKEQSGIKKYLEPDLSLLNLAPSIEEYFGPGALSDSAKTLAFGACWNINQYVDGYLFGITAGPQMNEPDIKKYIVFHKTLWDKLMESEPNLSKAATFDAYFRNMLNRGIDAFDSKDKIRIEQFHQEIHDLDTHLFRDDLSSKVYGATPFATKRSE
ncbi:MAG: hypothetical protein GX091_05770 [Peptococcaceae bacterium]|nr:hypothetical protein [Peptococcaceae bacterium]